MKINAVNGNSPHKKHGRLGTAMLPTHLRYGYFSLTSCLSNNQRRQLHKNNLNVKTGLPKAKNICTLIRNPTQTRHQKSGAFAVSGNPQVPLYGQPGIKNVVMADRWVRRRGRHVF